MNSTTNKKSASPLVMQMALLAEPLKFETQELERMLREKTGGQKVSVNGRADSQESFIVQWGVKTFAVMCIDKPVPKETFTTAIRTTPGLNNGDEIVKNHRAHVIVSPLANSNAQGQAILDSVDVISLTEMLTEAPAKPLGYFWSSAETLIGTDEYKKVLAKVNTAMAKQTSKNPSVGYDLPATYWVGYRLFPAKQTGLVGATTKGLAHYFGFEVELAPDSRKPASIAASVYSVVSFLFANGPVLKSGETIEIRPKEVFRIFHQASTTMLSERIILKREIP